VLTLSNKISLGRIFCIPPLVFCITQVQHNDHYRYACLFIVFIIGLTDVLDGYLARKRNEMTSLGRYLDPFADKLVLVISCIILSSDRIWPEPRFPQLDSGNYCLQRPLAYLWHRGIAPYHRQGELPANNTGQGVNVPPNYCCRIIACGKPRPCARPYRHLVGDGCFHLCLRVFLYVQRCKTTMNSQENSALQHSGGFTQKHFTLFHFFNTIIVVF